MTTVSITRRVVEMVGRGVRGLSAAGLARRHNGFTGTDAEYTDWLIGQVARESPTFGIDHYADTYADAVAALGGYADGTVVMVWVDEEVDDHRTIYMVESAALVLKADLTALKPIDMGDVMAFIPASFRGAVVAGTSAVDVSTYVQLAHDTCYTVDYRRVGKGWLRTTTAITLRSGAVALRPRIKLLGDVGDVSIFINETIQPADAAARDSNISILDFHLDGDRTNNTSAGEQSHGVRLCAVNGAVVRGLAENLRGDGVLVAPPDDADTTIPGEDIRVSLTARNCYRNSLSIVGGHRIRFDVISKNAGLCGVDLENDDGAGGTSSIRDVRGTVIDEDSGYDYVGPMDAPRTGYSLLMDGNTGVLDNVSIDVISRNHQDNGIGWRGVTNAMIRGQVVGCGSTGAIGIDGTTVASSITLDLEVVDPGGRGISDRTYAGGSLSTTRAVVRGAGGDLGMLIEGNISGTLAGVDIDSGGAYLDEVDNVVMIAPKISGGTGVALTLNDSDNNKLFGGVLDGDTNGLLESGTSNGNLALDIVFPSATAQMTGLVSVAMSAPIMGSATWNPASIPNGSIENKAIVVTGAALGDVIESLSFGQNLDGATLTGYVSAADTVQAVLSNNTGSARDFGDSIVTAVVRKVHRRPPP